jgi:hypothetical protein
VSINIPSLAGLKNAKLRFVIIKNEISSVMSILDKNEICRMIYDKFYFDERTECNYRYKNSTDTLLTLFQF